MKKRQWQQNYFIFCLIVAQVWNVLVKAWRDVPGYYSVQHFVYMRSLKQTYRINLWAFYLCIVNLCWSNICSYSLNDDATMFPCNNILCEVLDFMWFQAFQPQRYRPRRFEPCPKLWNQPGNFRRSALQTFWTQTLRTRCDRVVGRR